MTHILVIKGNCLGPWRELFLEIDTCPPLSKSRTNVGERNRFYEQKEKNSHGYGNHAQWLVHLISIGEGEATDIYIVQKFQQPCNASL